MTVIRVKRAQTFIGLATDDKPVTPPEGSTYHAVDTGEMYVFFDSMWEEDLSLADNTKVL